MYCFQGTITTILRHHQNFANDDPQTLFFVVWLQIFFFMISSQDDFIAKCMYLVNIINCSVSSAAIRDELKKNSYVKAIFHKKFSKS